MLFTSNGPRRFSLCSNTSIWVTLADVEGKYRVPNRLPSVDVKVTISFMHNEMFAAVMVELQPHRTSCTVTMRDS